MLRYCSGGFATARKTNIKPPVSLAMLRHGVPPSPALVAAALQAHNFSPDVIHVIRFRCPVHSAEKSDAMACARGLRLFASVHSGCAYCAACGGEGVLESACTSYP